MNAFVCFELFCLKTRFLIIRLGSGNDSVCESFIPSHSHGGDGGAYEKTCAPLLTLALICVRPYGAASCLATEYHRLSQVYM